jgi:predicted outer membrane repeat protein
LFWVAFVLPSPVWAATLQVGPSQTYTTIQAAIDAAQSGDIIEIAAGDYEESVLITKALTLSGPTTGVATIDGGALRAVEVEGSAVFELRDLALRSELQAFRGADCVGTLTRIDVRDIETDEDGAAVALEDCEVSLIDAAFEHNTALNGNGGHVYAVRTKLVVTGGTFINGYARKGGCLSLHDQSTLQVDGGSFTQCRVDGGPQNPGEGGHLYLDGGEATITSSSFWGGTTSSQGEGGGLWARDATLIIDDSSFIAHQGRDGGAIYVEDSDLFVTGGEFHQNYGSGSGGAIFADHSAVALAAVPFTENDASGGALTSPKVPSGCGCGGAVAVVGGTLVVQGGVWHKNRALKYGGALYADADVELTDLALTDNKMMDDINSTAGGAIAVYGGSKLRITDARIVGSSARSGGAVDIDHVADVLVRRTLFCENHATEFGGAVRIRHGGATQNLWTNNVFLQNTALRDGGAIQLDVAATFENDTFVENHADQGGAAALNGPFTATNTLWLRSQGDAVAVPSATGLSLDHDAWWSNSVYDVGLFNNGGDVAFSGTHVFADPLVAYDDDDLCDDYLVPAVGSPLIDAGDPDILDPDGSPSDIGAYGGPHAMPPTIDVDQDGSLVPVDCDDDDPTAHPGAEEVCDGVDNDCDSTVDGPGATDATDVFSDADQDGFGTGVAVVACAAQPEFAATNGDCDDNQPTVFPGAPETCDGRDNDCDGSVDEAAIDELIVFADLDLDGYGAGQSILACPGPGYSSYATDCDDADPQAFPGGVEVCDDVDQDCDGQVDEGIPNRPTWYIDADADGYGDPSESVVACFAPEGFVANADDCDDQDPDAHPDAAESCEDPADLNCDGFFGATDNDQDGFPACQDCDDGDAERNPDAPRSGTTASTATATAPTTSTRTATAIRLKPRRHRLRRHRPRGVSRARLRPASSAASRR